MHIVVRIFLSPVILIMLNAASFAQDSLSKKESPFSFNTDIVSSYLWRGSMISNVPNVQPYFSFSKKGFEIGSWGSAAINGDYSELDIYAAYNLNNLKFTLTDYYVFSELNNESYFNYANSKTDHSLEGTIEFSGTEKLPFKILAATFFYGNDKNDSGVNNHSTYFEATYSFSNFDVILGITPNSGMYAAGWGIVNTGIMAHKEIKITDHFSIPATFSLLANPLEEKIFFAVGFTL
jgi:hypothetical protein